ncbi:MAG TPA: hypothetical protein VHT52_19700 [Stellaceae bacterium]|nr:hypothetical protein [Stellaceae bacterium]
MGLGLRSTLAVPATIADTGERCSAPVERLEFGELAEFARKLAAARNLGDIAAFVLRRLRIFGQQDKLRGDRSKGT